MFTRNIYTIYELPIIPEGSTFKLSNDYAKIVLEDGREILYLYIKDEWQSTNKTLEEYNTKFIKQPNEYNIHEILKAQVPVWCKHGKTLYIFKDHDNNILVSYNKPVKKNGQRNGAKIEFIRAGETHSLNYEWEKRVFYDELVKIGVLDNFYVDIKFNQNKVNYEYTFEEHKKYQEWLLRKETEK